MADEYFLPPPPPSWVNSHLDSEVTYFQLTSCAKRSAEHRKRQAMGPPLLCSTQFSEKLTATFLGQAGTINLSLPLPNPATTYLSYLETDSDTVYNLFADLKTPPGPCDYCCAAFPLKHSLLLVMLLYLPMKCYHHSHTVTLPDLPVCPPFGSAWKEENMHLNDKLLVIRINSVYLTVTFLSHLR